MGSPCSSSNQRSVMRARPSPKRSGSSDVRRRGRRLLGELLALEVELEVAAADRAPGRRSRRPRRARCSIARWQKRRTAPMSWVTSTIVLPSSRRRLNSSKHFCWNDASPTASTSSMSRTSASTWIITLNASRTCMPERVVLELEVLELAQLGEVDDLLVALARLRRAQAEHDRVEDHVVARRQVGVEADAELDERRQPAVDPDVARRWPGRCRPSASAASLLPDPLRPTMPKNSPRSTWKETSSTAVKRVERPAAGTGAAPAP